MKLKAPIQVVQWLNKDASNQAKVQHSIGGAEQAKNVSKQSKTYALGLNLTTWCPYSTGQFLPKMGIEPIQPNFIPLHYHSAT